MRNFYTHATTTTDYPTSRKSHIIAHHPPLPLRATSRRVDEGYSWPAMTITPGETHDIPTAVSPCLQCRWAAAAGTMTTEGRQPETKKRRERDREATARPNHRRHVTYRATAAASDCSQGRQGGQVGCYSGITQGGWRGRCCLDISNTLLRMVRDF
jgi:hypothetical protein